MELSCSELSCFEKDEQRKAAETAAVFSGARSRKRELLGATAIVVSGVVFFLCSHVFAILCENRTNL